MVRVVVVEDERKYAEQLEQFVYRYGEEHAAALILSAITVRRPTSYLWISKCRK